MLYSSLVYKFLESGLSDQVVRRLFPGTVACKELSDAPILPVQFDGT